MGRKRGLTEYGGGTMMVRKNSAAFGLVERGFLLTLGMCDIFYLKKMQCLLYMIILIYKMTKCLK